MPNDDLDVALFDWRGVKLTFRLPTLAQDANGEIIEDIRFGDDGSLSSNRVDRLITYADIIADRLDAERAKGGLLQAAQRAVPQAGQWSPPPGYVPSSPPPGVPVMGGGGVPTGYAPPPQADQACPQCGGALGGVKQTSRGPLRECLQQVRQCLNAKGYPNSVWLQQGGRR